MNNLKNKINKLLFAISRMGIIYRLNSIRVYSENKDRYCTKYELFLRYEYEQENERTGEKEVKKKYIKVLDSFDEAEILKYLVNDYEDYKKEMMVDDTISEKQRTNT